MIQAPSQWHGGRGLHRRGQPSREWGSWPQHPCSRALGTWRTPGRDGRAFHRNPGGRERRTTCTLGPACAQRWPRRRQRLSQQVQCTVLCGPWPHCPPLLRSHLPKRRRGFSVLNDARLRKHAGPVCPCHVRYDDLLNTHEPTATLGRNSSRKARRTLDIHHVAASGRQSIRFIFFLFF